MINNGNMSLNKLTIIVPVYNMEGYLENCIESILSQTYKPFEIILVDDGSIDRSVAICDRYTIYENIKVIHKPNGGLISARKAGIAVATGDYIGFVDADDWIEPNMYECLMKEASIHYADIVSCGYYLDKGASRGIVKGVNEKQVIKSFDEHQKFFEGILAKGFDWTNNRNIPPSVCNKVFRKTLLERTYESLDDRIIWDEDTVTVLSVALNSECIVLVPDILYHYRQNMTSMCHTINRRVIQNYVYVFDELERLNREHDGILDTQIPYFSFSAIRTALEVGFGVESGKQYMFPFDKIKQGSKVVIYGAGQVGSSYFNVLSSVAYASEVFLTDSNPDSWTGDVISPEDAFKHEYDVVIIAVENESTAEKIKESLIKRGIDKEELFWEKPVVVKDTYSFRMR